MEHNPPDLLKADLVTLAVRKGVECLFDLPRVGDLSDYIFQEREDRLKKLVEHQNIINSDDVKLSMLIQFSSLNLESMLRMVATLHGQAWLVDRCYVRANSEVKEDYKISLVLTIAEVRTLFHTLCALTGLISANPQEEGEKSEEKSELSHGTPSTQKSLDDTK